MAMDDMERQGAPPDGGGLLQSRRLFLKPSPHVALQAPQSDHCDHPPSTAIQYVVLRFNIFCYKFLMICTLQLLSYIHFKVLLPCNPL